MTYKPHNYLTFPRGVVYIRRCLDHSIMFMVTSINKYGVTIGGAQNSYKTISRFHEVSTDLGNTWSPCGVNKERGD